MGCFDSIGSGSKEAQLKALKLRQEYENRFGKDAPILLVDFLPKDKRTAEHTIEVYERCLKEGKTVDQVVEYEREYRDDVIY
jgi:hypothetical protein